MKLSEIEQVAAFAVPGTTWVAATITAGGIDIVRLDGRSETGQSLRTYVLASDEPHVVASAVLNIPVVYEARRERLGL